MASEAHAAPRPAAAPGATAPVPAIGEGYARYMLAVLVVVYVLNFLDRQILAILAERIKADLDISDAQMGFLYGTAFAVFYAVFGIPLGRLADVWDRRRLIAWGLAAWSAMTAVSGLASNYTQLALARVGVGIGEASASPAAYSLLSDVFPRARRATVLAIYSSGIYIGAGLGLGIGGLIVDRWDAAWAGAAAPFGLRGWQVAFLAVGLPGLLLALWVRTLREPVRGAIDGVPAPRQPHPWRAFFRELAAVLPPVTVASLVVEARRGGAASSLAGAGARARRGPVAILAVNLALAAAAALGAVALTRWLGNPAQWWSLAIGGYAGASWAQSLALRDRPAFALIFRGRALLASNLAAAFLAFTSYAYGFWVAPLLIRTHGADLARLGLVLGGIAAAGGWLGVTMGGLLADRLRRRSAAGRLYVTMAAAVLPVPLSFALLAAPSLGAAYLIAIPIYAVSSMWLGPALSTIQDLVLPRVRAVASAVFLLIVAFLGLAMGPYTVGRLSVALGDLRPALLWALVANGLALACAIACALRIARDEATVSERAAAAGEP